jgi:hypothetical protein
MKTPNDLMCDQTIVWSLNFNQWNALVYLYWLLYTLYDWHFIYSSWLDYNLMILATSDIQNPKSFPDE